MEYEDRILTVEVGSWGRVAHVYIIVDDDTTLRLNLAEATSLSEQLANAIALLTNLKARS